MTKPRRALAALGCAAALTAGMFTVAPPAAANTPWALYDCELADGTPYWSEMYVEFTVDGMNHLVMIGEGPLPADYPVGAISARIEFAVGSAITGIHNAQPMAYDFFVLERANVVSFPFAPNRIVLNFIPTPGTVDCYRVIGSGS